MHAANKAEHQPGKVIDHLFAALAGKYGRAWTSLFPKEVPEALVIARTQWAEELAGVDVNLIKYGIDQCSNKHPSWPPNQMEFKALCRVDPVHLGLPSVDTAWSEICSEKKEYSHGVVLAARLDKRCDSYNWRKLPASAGLKLFTPIYQDYINRTINGEVFELLPQVEDKTEMPLTLAERKAYAKKHLASVFAALKTNEGGI